MLRPLMQAVIGTEAGLGFFLNIFVLRVIANLSDKTLQHYKFCLTVSTVHSILTSITNVVCVLTHIIDHDAVYSSFNGLSLLFPKWAADVSLVIWILLTVFAWTSLPAAFLLQYMIIVKHSIPTWRILSYIYLTCLLISTPIFFTVNDAFPLPSFAETLEPTVRSMYALSPEERVLVYGGTLFPRPENGNRTFALYIFLGVGLTFSASYGIVLFCVRGILKAIRDQTVNNVSRSSKSLKMQKRFITMLMLEATVPFFFLGVCVGVFTLAGLVGVELGLYALVMSTFVAMVPAVQAILYIWHLRGRSGDRSPSHTTTVSAQRTTARSTTVRNSDSLVAQTRQESATGND
ncbi:hypothetical protein PRIPAC_78774 [Pristionchus pacificus]|uniref:G protein-coupled receptor n=1 Tax=Pristionchus pacificus TaxID=54126 RepID=A0A2A6C2I7_PRIPA|nr:hypothetical protein PRIPAC_78774 [Pristionchus pacificus]|eukprot:PDM72243.1 G protein-coupled receptor [Pristionchus pacificus]